MRTFDGVKLAMDNLAAKLKNYPGSSLSPRTVITELPINKDVNDLAIEVNSKITLAIYKHAEENASIKRSQQEHEKSLTSHVLQSLKS